VTGRGKGRNRSHRIGLLKIKYSAGPREVRTKTLVQNLSSQIHFTDLGSQVVNETATFPIGILTHVSEVPIKDFYISVDNLERNKLVIILCNITYKEEGSIAPIYDLQPHVG